MQRREFITLFGGTAATWPLAAHAQQPSKIKRIAFVHSAGNVSCISASGAPFYRAFFEELSHLGYVEDKTSIQRSRQGRSPPRRRNRDAYRFSSLDQLIDDFWQDVEQTQ